MKKQTHEIKEYWGVLGDMSCNGYAVHMYLLKDNAVFLETTRYGRKVKNHWKIVDKEFLKTKWNEAFYNETNAYSQVLNCLEFLNPLEN